MINTYDAATFEKFTDWLQENGAILKDLTNLWEVARWYGNGKTCVIYKNKHDQLSFGNAESRIAYTAFAMEMHFAKHGVPNGEPPPRDIDINPHRIDEHEAYMRMAEVWAKRSKANRLQVGAIIVKDRQIISDGYNGMPTGAESEVCEVWMVRDKEPHESFMKTKPDVLHAESNAIAKLAWLGGRGAAGATMYVTHAPCLQCAKMIIQSGITRVVYRNDYRSMEGRDLLEKYRVSVVKQERE